MAGQPTWDPVEKANEHALETLKQLLTLATAVLALTITFLKDALGQRSGEAGLTWFVPSSWSGLLVAIWTAWVAMADASRRLGLANSRVYIFGEGKPRILARIAQWSFAVALTLMGIFAIWNYKLFFRGE